MAWSKVVLEGHQRLLASNQLIKQPCNYLGTLISDSVNDNH